MLLALDKPHGISSYDCIRELKRHFPPKTKIGHAGTLDPYATGLMLIGVGKGTKRLHSLTGMDKSYRATIDFSQASDTRDLQYRKKHIHYPVTEQQGKTGIIIHDLWHPAPSQHMLATTLQRLIPQAELPLTPFSAKKHQGKKLYEYAREGNPVFLHSTMATHSFQIHDYSFPHLEISITVGSGTYIRSIAHRLGKQHGLGGILTHLRRTHIGPYSLQTGTWDKKYGQIRGYIIDDKE